MGKWTKLKATEAARSHCWWQGPARAACLPVESSGLWLVPALRDSLNE